MHSWSLQDSAQNKSDWVVAKKKRRAASCEVSPSDSEGGRMERHERVRVAVPRLTNTLWAVVTFHAKHQPITNYCSLAQKALISGLLLFCKLISVGQAPAQ